MVSEQMSPAVGTQAFKSSCLYIAVLSAVSPTSLRSLPVDKWIELQSKALVVLLQDIRWQSGSI